MEHQLIGPEQLRSWADAWVLELEVPARWLLELCTVQDAAEALRILSDFMASWPLESFDAEEGTDTFVAGLLLRHRQGRCSWATVLREAGQRLDAANGRRHCEEFYALLTEWERQGGARALEVTQRAEVEREYSSALERMESVYRLLRSPRLGAP